MGRVRVARGILALVESLRIHAGWRTEGKGDEASALQYDETFRGAESFTSDNLAEFAFLLPQSPLSYDGVLFKIHWSVTATATLTGGNQHTAIREFTLGDVEIARIAT